MNNEFWQQCWQDDNIGFHQADVNGHLMKFFPEFSLSTDKNVFVPLCGKTLDMAWLMQKNMHVWGIDISA